MAALAGMEHWLPLFEDNCHVFDHLGTMTVVSSCGDRAADERSTFCGYYRQRQETPPRPPAAIALCRPKRSTSRAANSVPSRRAAGSPGGDLRRPEASGRSISASARHAISRPNGPAATCLRSRLRALQDCCQSGKRPLFAAIPRIAQPIVSILPIPERRSNRHQLQEALGARQGTPVAMVLPLDTALPTTRSSWSPNRISRRPPGTRRSE